MTLKTAIASILLATACITATNAQATIRRDLDIPAQELGSALVVLAKQARIQVVYSADLVQGHSTHALSGSMTPDEALGKLLDKTGLKYEFLDEQTVTLSTLSSKEGGRSSSGAGAAGTGEVSKGQGSWNRLRIAQAESSSPSGKQGTSQDSASNPEIEEIDEIVVTGTYIRGTSPVGSSLRTYSREEITRSGAASVDQFARYITENFSNTDIISNANSSAGRYGGSSGNNYGGAAFNLRGIGPAATLTLVNGNRLAPAGQRGGITDISHIPLSAVERIEILTDGASALYGADAVAGVVNIIMRSDFEGAETSVRYGGADHGGGEQITASQLLGFNWGSGNVLLNYEYDRREELQASQRSFVPEQGGPYSLIPEIQMDGLFLAASQELGASTKITSNVMWGERETDSRTRTQSSLFNSDSIQSFKVSDVAVATSLEHEFSDAWHAKLSAGYSRVRQDGISRSLSSLSGASTVDIWANSQLREGNIVLNGMLGQLPAGAVKIAFGGGYREDDFQNFSRTTVSIGSFPITMPELERQVASYFAELRIPLFDAKPIGKAELSLAARSDEYSDFGSAENYKVGMTWSPTSLIDVRATYGTSFRAPLLSDLGTITRYDASRFPNGAGGFVNIIQISGGNPGLSAEESTSWTAGVDLDISIGLKVALTYFDINFTDKISTPPVTGNILTNPVAAAFVNRQPSVEELQWIFSQPSFRNAVGASISSIGAIYDSRAANIASTRQSGLDLSLAYPMSLPYGQMDLSIAAEYLVRNRTQPLATQPSVNQINRFAQPPRWRTRGVVAWALAPFSASLSVNYVNSYQNGLGATALSTGSTQMIDAWTTADVSLTYATSQASGFLNGLTVGLFVQNVTDEDPPFVEIPSTITLPGERTIPFDAANASPMGRFFSLQVSKRW